VSRSPASVNLTESSVALIAKQKIAHRIVRHEDVGQPVTVDIGEGDSIPLPILRPIPDACDTSVNVPSWLLWKS
jgi:hypothetical protein